MILLLDKVYVPQNRFVVNKIFYFVLKLLKIAQLLNLICGLYMITKNMLQNQFEYWHS